MTGELAVIDTNILVYAYEEATEPDKNKVCFKLIEECLSGKRKLALSNQILSEFITVASRKLAIPFPLERIEKIIRWINTYTGYIKLNYSTTSTETALKFVQLYGVSYWDALVTVTMIENKIFTIYTENEKDFLKIPGIKVINPLKKNAPQ